MDHHESILIEPQAQTPHSNQVKVTIESETIYEVPLPSHRNKNANANGNANANANNKNKLLTSRKDALLLSILDQLELDSYSVSVSDSSDSSISQFDLNTLLFGGGGGGGAWEDTRDGDEDSTCNRTTNGQCRSNTNANVNANKNGDTTTFLRTFPVGTSIQYSKARVSNSDNDRDGDSDSKKRSEMHSGFPNQRNGNQNEVIDENKLLRLLRTSGLLCENVQMDDILRSKEPTSTSISKSVRKPNNQDKNELNANTNPTDYSRLIVIPTDAFTLCHSVSLYNMILSSSPCRDKLGILSKFHLSTLNDADVTNRAVWMSVDKYQVTDRESDTDSDIGTDNSNSSSSSNKVSIKWGIRFEKRLYKDSVSLGDVMIDKHFPTNEYLNGGPDGNDKGNGNGDVQLEHCPMSSSSTIFTRQSHSSNTNRNKLEMTMKERDLQQGAISMGEELIQIDTDYKDTKNYDNMWGATIKPVGIERHVLRRNGVAHFGTFQSRIYVDEISHEFCQNNHHQLLSNEEHKGGDEGPLVGVSVVDYYPNFVRPVFHSLKAFVVSSGNSGHNGPYKTTELDLFNLPGHNLELAPDGSSSLSFSTTLPPKSSLYIEMDYEPLFLPFEVFPADPNRGIDVKPSYATFSVTCPLQQHQQYHHQQQQRVHAFQLYSNALLIMPPVPDMSMPFNVISLCGTCFAILIGASINLIVKKSSESVKDTLKGVKTKTPIQKMKDKLKSKITMLKQKVTGKIKRKRDSEKLKTS